MLCLMRHAEIDDIKLKECDNCDLVKHCGVECREDHKAEHKGVCKKRAAELRDELLFKQPENSCFGNCPICMIPLPLDTTKSVMCMCCSKVICIGCNYANAHREIRGRLAPSCPFCRESTNRTVEEWDKQRMKRIEAGDPAAMVQQGGDHLINEEYQSAIEYFAKAAALGSTWAHFNLACLYHEGKGVEKDERKETYHLEEAAIGGHPGARYNLGSYQWRIKGNAERAVKH